MVANPPYIPTGEIEALAPEVRDHEPRLALDGGPDGLAAYRRLAPEILRVLKPGGVFAVEIGHDQGQAVRRCWRPPARRDRRATRTSPGATAWWRAPRKPLEIDPVNR